jgi:hypothetical protein
LSIQVRKTLGEPLKQLLSNAARAPGSHTEIWDGRKDDSAFHQGSFEVFFEVPGVLPVDTIILRRAPIEFQNFRAEAYLIQPVFGEVSALTYTLNRNANVTIILNDPNGNVVRMLLSNVPQAAGPQSVEWDGRTDSGQLAHVEGDYKVTLTGVDPVSGLSATRTGVIVVYK